MALATEFKDVWFGQHHPYVSRLGIQVTLDPGPAVTQDHPGAEGRSRAGHAQLDSQQRTDDSNGPQGD